MKTIFAVVAATSFPLCAWSAPIQCPDGQGIYKGVAAPTNELIFSSDQKGTLKLAKGRVRAAYPFTVTHSNGFSRVHIIVSGKDAPTSVAMSFNPDFTPYLGQASAPYLVTPDLPVGFHYWDPFRSRAELAELLPGDAWYLSGCSPSAR